MKRITNTLLIVTLFTSNIIASQGCIGGVCMATFGKKADDVKAIATNISYQVDSMQNNINIIKERSSVEEESSFPETVVSEEEIISTQIEPTILEEENTETREYLENNIDTDIKLATTLEDETLNTNPSREYLENNIDTNIKLTTILEDETLNTNPYCEEEQGVLSCDITGDTSECTCV